MPATVPATLDLNDPKAVERRKRALGASTFEYRGRPFAYHVAGGNKPFDNERAVELAIAWHILSAHRDPTTVIEIGNVLPHYFPTQHAVLDKFEHHRAVTWNEDVREFVPPFAPELIVSVSSLEHVGHIETPRDPTGFRRAVDNLLSWLRPGGELFITVPLGYNPSVLALLEDPTQPFDDIDVMKRVSAENEWGFATLGEVREVNYGRPLPCANAVVIACARKPAPTGSAGLPSGAGVEAPPATGASTSAELKNMYDRSYYGRMAGGQVHERKGHLRELTNIWRAASLVLAPQIRAATDVGAGRGDLALHLLEGGARVTLLDYSEPAMEIAREYIGEREFASFVVGDAARLSKYVEPASQDAVFMTDVVEHISSPELRAIFGQVRGVLAPGGTLIVHTPEKYCGTVTSKAAVQGVHINLFQVDTLRELLAETFEHADAFTWNGVERFASRGKCIELFGIGRHAPFPTDSYPEAESRVTSETCVVAAQPGEWSSRTLADGLILPPRFILRLDLEVLASDGDARFQVLLCDAAGAIIAWTGLSLSAVQESPADLFLASETFNRVKWGTDWDAVARVVARACYVEGGPVELRVTDIRVLHA